MTTKRSTSSIGFQRAAFREGHGVRDFMIDLGLDRRNLGGGDEMVVLQPSLETHDRTLLSPSFDFVFCPIGLGVKHRVSPELIGFAFEKARPAAVADHFHRPARRTLHSYDVHPIDFFGRHSVTVRLSGDMGLGVGPLNRHAHCVKIILAYE